MNPSRLLAVLAFVFMNTGFVMAIIYSSSYKPWWISSYTIVVLFYAVLYCRRRRHFPEGLRCQMAKVAVALAAILSVLFFYSCPPGMPWWVAIAAWFGLAATAYFLHGVFFSDDDEQEAEQAQQVAMTSLPPV